jgi:hypothetical protein
MKTLKVVLLSSILFLQLISCKSNPLEIPITVKEVAPGRRDYVWQETELQIPAGESAYLGGIWGSSPNDVWATGSASEMILSAWHFDGVKWTNTSAMDPNNQTYEGQAIWGTDANNIWVGNAGGVICNYDGVRWNYIKQLVDKDYGRVTIEHMWGVSANEIYFAGYAGGVTEAGTHVTGVIYKYDGIEWKRIGMPDMELNFFDVRKANNGDLVILAIDENTLLINVLVYNGSELKTLIANDENTTALEKVGDKILISQGQIMYEYDDGNLKIWKNFSGTQYKGAIWCARNEKDIFTGAQDKVGYAIGHYNGIDFQIIYPAENINIYCVAGLALPKDVFFILVDWNTLRTKILHGKLND